MIGKVREVRGVKKVRGVREVKSVSDEGNYCIHYMHVQLLYCLGLNQG